MSDPFANIIAEQVQLREQQLRQRQEAEAKDHERATLLKAWGAVAYWLEPDGNVRPCSDGPGAARAAAVAAVAALNAELAKRGRLELLAGPPSEIQGEDLQACRTAFDLLQNAPGDPGETGRRVSQIEGLPFAPRVRYWLCRGFAKVVEEGSWEGVVGKPRQAPAPQPQTPDVAPDGAAPDDLAREAKALADTLLRYSRQVTGEPSGAGNEQPEAENRKPKTENATGGNPTPEVDNPPGAGNETAEPEGGEPIVEAGNGTPPLMPPAAPGAPNEAPRKLLRGWHAIAAAVSMPYRQREDVKRLNASRGGPITCPGRGKKPMVYCGDLINWWNQLATQQQDLANQQEGARLSAKGAHHFGRDGKAAPEIGGGVKKRRQDKRT
jgi:hypothetical protein